MRTLKISLLVLLLSIAISAQNFWEQPFGPTGTIIRTLAVNSGNDIYCGLLYGKGIFRSTDNGFSWIDVNNELTNLSILSIAVNTNDLIFAATEDGIVRSLNNGVDWEPVDNGLLYGNVDQLEIGSDDFIVAGT